MNWTIIWWMHTPMQGDTLFNIYENSRSKGSKGVYQLLRAGDRCSFRPIWTHVHWFRLIQALLSSFRLVSTHFNSCIIFNNRIYIEPHSEEVYLYEERKLRLINLKALYGSWASKHTHKQVASFFPWQVF